MRDLHDTQKPHQLVYANEKSKRQRNDLDPSIWLVPQATIPQLATNKKSGKAPQVAQKHNKGEM